MFLFIQSTLGIFSFSFALSFSKFGKMYPLHTIESCTRYVIHHRGVLNFDQLWRKYCTYIDLRWSQFRECFGVCAEFFDSLSLSVLLPEYPSVSLHRGQVLLEDPKVGNSLTSKPNPKTFDLMHLYETVFTGGLNWSSRLKNWFCTSLKPSSSASRTHLVRASMKLSRAIFSRPHEGLPVDFSLLTSLVVYHFPRTTEYCELECLWIIYTSASYKYNYSIHDFQKRGHGRSKVQYEYNRISVIRISREELKSSIYRGFDLLKSPGKRRLTGKNSRYRSFIRRHNYIHLFRKY